MNILLVGYIPIPRNITGGTQFLDFIASTLRRYGHNVAMYTTENNVDKNGIESVFYNGIEHFIEYRDKTTYYGVPDNPMKEVYDTSSNSLFHAFLDEHLGEYDIIHFNHYMPLSGIEYACSIGYKTVVTLHDFQFITGSDVNLFSKKSCDTNPTGILSMTTFSAEHITKEIMYKFNIDDSKFDTLLVEYTKRIEYGISLLSKVGAVLGNGSYPTYYHAQFGVDYKNMVHLPMLRKPFVHSVRKELYSSKDKIVFGVTNYIAYNKGFEFLIEAVSLLKEYENMFVVKLLGACNGEYGDSIISRITEDSFLSEHILWDDLNGYNPDDISLVFEGVDVIINPSQDIIGGGSTYWESILRSVPVFAAKSYVYNAIHYYLLGNTVADAVKKSCDEFGIHVTINEKYFLELVEATKGDFEKSKPFYELFSYVPGDVNGFAEKMVGMIEMKERFGDIQKIVEDHREYLLESHKNYIEDEYIKQLISEYEHICVE